jgi:hypothetical protein
LDKIHFNEFIDFILTLMNRNFTSLTLAIVFVLFNNCNNNSLAENQFTPLFNGEDLEGWVNVNCAPETWSVREGMIICTGIPTGILRTERQYENFILELEWKHLHKDGNAGLFIHSDDITAPGQPFSRSVECQIMDGNHGDVFAIHGASMTRDNEDPFYRVGWMRTFPKEEMANPFGQWNHYRVESRDGILTLAVNGEVVSRAFHVNPRKGYICLESEGSEVHFKNIRIKELSGSFPLPEQTSLEDRGYRSLYNGLDFRGWKNEGNEGPWETDNWRLVCKGSSNGVTSQTLWTEAGFKDFRLTIDWRFTGEPEARSVPVILPDGSQALDSDGQEIFVPIRYAGEGKILLRGSEQSGIIMTTWPEGSGGLAGYREDGVLDPDTRKLSTPILRADKAIGEWNRFEIKVVGDQLNVVLNDRQVIRNANIPGLSEKGIIGIQAPDFPMEFANIYIENL